MTYLGLCPCARVLSACVAVLRLLVVVVRSAYPCLHHLPRRPVLGHLSPFDLLFHVLLSTCALSTKKTKKTKKMKKTLKALLPMKGWMWASLLVVASCSAFV